MARTLLSRRTGYVAALALASTLALALPSITRAADLDRSAALAALQAPAATQRLAAVARLAEIGSMADADRLLPALDDTDEAVRAGAVASMWRIWSRSGDDRIDALFQHGVAQMRAGEMAQAQDTFSEIIRQKPDFAEGWNKRATIRFLMGDLQRSLADCQAVLERNANHFGALTGAAQIYLRLDDTRQAVRYLERALQVNPHLVGVPEALKTLKAHLERDRSNRI